jgi:hypothetical protein
VRPLQTTLAEMAFLKSLFRKPLTQADLLQEGESLIRKPPLPPDLKAGVLEAVGRSGVNLLDYWRDYFKSQLGMISQEQSWGLQRAKLLKLVILEQGWQAAHIVAQTAQSTESWSHLLNDIEWADGAEKKNLKGLLLQRWLVAILSDACLRTIGVRCYALDRTKELEIGICYEFDKEIKSLDVSLSDLMHTAVIEYRDDDARFIAAFKDDVVNPIIREQYKLLSLLEDDVANGSVDLASIGKKISSFNQRKAKLAEQIQSSQTRIG